MINQIFKTLFKREIILINPHRNALPLINKNNKRKFIFLNPKPYWKLTAILGRKSKLRYRTIAIILSLIKPKYIIDINWLTKIQTLYWIWCRKNNAKFIVVQHGVYVGGVITDIPHRKAKCDIFLAWSPYWKDLITGYNKGKRLEIKISGNPVYNSYNRDEFSYKKNIGNRLLLVPSVIKNSRYEEFHSLIKKLMALGFDVMVKEHIYQSKLYREIKFNNKVSGDLYTILKGNDFDIVITDVSSAMLDTIFFKKLVVFFSPEGDEAFFTKNIYSNYLKNLASEYPRLTSQENLREFTDINSQESLFNHLVFLGKNNLDHI